LCKGLKERGKPTVTIYAGRKAIFAKLGFGLTNRILLKGYIIEEL
jgi:hypothetical protein